MRLPKLMQRVPFPSLPLKFFLSCCHSFSALRRTRHFLGKRAVVCHRPIGVRCWQRKKQLLLRLRRTKAVLASGRVRVRAIECRQHKKKCYAKPPSHCHARRGQAGKPGESATPANPFRGWKVPWGSRPAQRAAAGRHAGPVRASGPAGLLDAIAPNSRIVSRHVCRGSVGCGWI